MSRLDDEITLQTRITILEAAIEAERTSEASVWDWMRDLMIIPETSLDGSVWGMLIEGIALKVQALIEESHESSDAEEADTLIEDAEGLWAIHNGWLDASFEKVVE